MIEESQIMVSIQCITYNHEPYIRQCLEGFVMQKTNFKFEAIVHDDASTDGTASIIQEFAEKYPNIIKPIYETENQYSKHDGSLNRIMVAQMRGKYIAICEGDDYWIDPLKLQKQVDFLEANSEYGMVYSQCSSYYQETGKYDTDSMGGPDESFNKLLLFNCIPTLTTVFKKDLYFQYLREINPSSKRWMMGDYPMWLWFSHESKIKFLNINTSVYRFVLNSASHPTDIDKYIQFLDSNIDIKNFFINYFEFTHTFFKKDRLYYRSIIYKYAQVLNYKQFFNIWLLYIKDFPMSLFDLRCWFYLVVKMIFVSLKITK